MPAGNVLRHLLRDVRRIFGEQALQIINCGETEAVAIKNSSAGLTLDRVHLWPGAHLQHASEAKPLVSDPRIYRLAAEGDVCDGLQIFANEAGAAVRDVEATVRQLSRVQDDSDLAVATRWIVRVMSVLYQLNEKAVAVVVGDELRHVSQALVETRIAASRKVVLDASTHQTLDAL